MGRERDRSNAAIIDSNCKNYTQKVLFDQGLSLQSSFVVGVGHAATSAQRVSIPSLVSKAGVGFPSGTSPSFFCSARTLSRKSKSICPSKSFTLYPRVDNLFCKAMRASRESWRSSLGQAALIGLPP